MKRREFLKAAGVGLATSTIAAPAIAQSMPDIRALWVSPDGEATAPTIAELAAMDLSYGVVLLPPGCGGLERGMFRPRPTAEVLDVAEEEEDPERRRYIVRFHDGWEGSHLASGNPPEAWPDPRGVSELRRFAEEFKLGKPTVIEIRVP